MLVLSLTIFCFLPLVISSIALVISVFNFYLLIKIESKANAIDENIVEIMREYRDKYYYNEH